MIGESSVAPIEQHGARVAESGADHECRACSGEKDIRKAVVVEIGHRRSPAEFGHGGACCKSDVGVAAVTIVAMQPVKSDESSPEIGDEDVDIAVIVEVAGSNHLSVFSVELQFVLATAPAQ